MSITTSSSTNLDVSPSFHPEADRLGEDHVHDPLAQFFLNRANGDPKKLADMPLHIRACRSWVRNRVLLPYLHSLPPKSDERDMSEPGKAALMEFPEFFGDSGVRVAARMSPVTDPAAAANLGRMGREQSNFPSMEPVDGEPISDASPARLKIFALMNGSARTGTCEACSRESVPLTYETTLVVRGIETLQMMVGSCCQHVIEEGDAEAVYGLLYRRARVIGS